MDGGLTCKGPECLRTFGSADDPKTRERARVSKWHVWSGPTVGGGWEEMVLCPSCVRGAGSKASAPTVEQESLW